VTRQPRVTICVPVYNGRAFVEETLESIQRQRYKNWTALISDDRSDRSADLCRRFTRDPRFSLCVQPVRLGWVENTNWLLRHAGGELACVVSHDDLLEPDHITQLVSCLASEDRCALAFTDVRVVTAWSIRARFMARRSSGCGASSRATSTEPRSTA
jgi:glycosyltransferase involved in cell wall biosynthesis